jgi:hypothetical protein
LNFLALSKGRNVDRADDDNAADEGGFHLSPGRAGMGPADGHSGLVEGCSPACHEGKQGVLF